MTTIILGILGIAAVAVVLFFTYYAFNEKPLPWAKDKTAKQAVGVSSALNTVQRWAKLNNTQVISSATLQSKNLSAYADAILVGPFGVLGIKCLGLNGDIYGEKNDGAWLQVVNDERISFENPLTECNVCARLIREALFAAGIKNTNVDCIAVFCNKKANIAVPRSAGIVFPHTLKDTLNKDKYTIDKGLDTQKAAEAIKTFIK
ncbi:MAG: nuclease-related domain-containing protein [Oscillospiraceae bacterium]|nr:nuclease-related domain-containing protein [Oscillospiraceae bacterium]